MVVWILIIVAGCDGLQVSRLFLESSSHRYVYAITLSIMLVFDTSTSRQIRCLHGILTNWKCWSVVLCPHGYGFLSCRGTIESVGWRMLLVDGNYCSFLLRSRWCSNFRCRTDVSNLNWRMQVGNQFGCSRFVPRKWCSGSYGIVNECAAEPDLWC
jgi:hypothetical protein